VLHAFTPWRIGIKPRRGFNLYDGELAMAGTAAFAQDASEQTEIRAVVARYAEAWNRHDIAALADILTDDTDWINIVGMHWRGKAAVLKGHDVYHRTFFRDTALDFTDVDLRPITQDAVVAVVTIKVGDFTPPDGQPRIGTQDRLSLIIAKRSGGWRIVHGHNTVIEPGAQRFDPVNSNWDSAGKAE
jgi:uncharacterized protein (TIGR02246 family)